MTNDSELSLIWRQLTNIYQQLNSTNNTAQQAYLTQLAEMYRLEYRHLTSTYR